MAQRVGRGIALLFHDRGTRRGRVVSSTPRPHFTPEKDLVPILHKAGQAPGQVWMGGKSCPHQDSTPDRPARSSVTIPTELPCPPYNFNSCNKPTTVTVTRNGHKMIFSGRSKRFSLTVPPWLPVNDTSVGKKWSNEVSTVLKI